MKTKILLAISCLAGLLYACSNTQEEEKKQLNDILAIHDKVMSASEAAMKNRAHLDSLIKKYGTDTSKTKPAVILEKSLDDADEAMENWMHQFNPDYTGKSHEQIMEYLHGQHEQLLKVDSQLNDANNQSAKYLSTVK